MVHNMNTVPLLITSSLAGDDTCNTLDHYVFRDPVSGYNIFYPLTAYGGPIAIPFTITTTITGGTFVNFCFRDNTNRIIDYPAISTHCITTINFVLSGLDESISKINKVIFTFSDDNSQMIVTKNLLTKESIADRIVSKTIYPVKRDLITNYQTTIKVIYDNSFTSTFIVPISSFRCGILDLYEQAKLLNSQQTAKPYDVVLTMEDSGTKQIFNNLLLTNEPFYATPSLRRLPNLVEPMPPDAPLTTQTPVVTTQQVRPNPIVAPPPFYNYVQGDGIILNPSAVTITLGIGIDPADDSIEITGDGLPYFASPSILITG